jgi:hypothetical protein
MFTRRKTIVAAGALVAGTAIGLPALAATDGLDPLDMQILKNVHKQFFYDDPSATPKQLAQRTSMGAIAMQINAAFLIKFREEFFPDPSIYMSGPVGEHNGKIVQACTRKLSSNSTFAIDADGLPQKSDIDREIFDALATSFAHEFRSEIERNSGPERMHPYVPITTSGIVTLGNGNGAMSFMTRYGWA